MRCNAIKADGDRGRLGGGAAAAGDGRLHRGLLPDRQAAVGRERTVHRFGKTERSFADLI